MSTLRARLHFSFPYAYAAEYLRDGLVPSGRTGTHDFTLTARVPATHIELSKDVIVQCERDPTHDMSWSIRWIPEGSNVYPTFEGTLHAYPRKDSDLTILELAGQYAPPFGIAGEVFDHVLGHKIALNTAYDFLLNIAEEIKARYALEEARELFREFDTMEASLPAGDVPERLR